jgi:hypothetical protein
MIRAAIRGASHREAKKQSRVVIASALQAGTGDDW